MSKEKANLFSSSSSLFIYAILISVTQSIVAGDSLYTDKEVLLNLKDFLEAKNPASRGRYKEWNLHSENPCDWQGISCTLNGSRVSGIYLSDNDIAGEIFDNFFALTELSHLDLSSNTLSGNIPEDLSRCQNLVYLNLSQNILGGTLNLVGLHNLKILDLSVNRIRGDIQLSFPEICDNLVVANISANRFTGEIGNSFDECHKLQYLDVSSNGFTGDLWPGFARLMEFSASENDIGGYLSSSNFPANCSLQVLDLSENNITDAIPGEISNCRNLTILNLWGNRFTGRIPEEIGLLSSLQGLFLGNNSFDREIPESLLNLSNLVFLDFCKNRFGGEVQNILGRFMQVKYLALHGNGYTGGIYTSGILKLPNIERLDLSYNNFSGPLPVEFSQMPRLKFLVLAHNQFSGNIPPQFGNITQLQALDLSFNKLRGSIPPTLGNLRSLLWLMLANNGLTGEIPPEIGNCTGLLWLNLANNQFRGKFPIELTQIGKSSATIFDLNRQDVSRVTAGSGECLTVNRWIPAEHPPFSFAYKSLKRKSCSSMWDKLLKGYGIFPACTSGPKARILQISGYVQLNDNQLSGELPKEIGEMHHISMLHLGVNKFHGKLPREIGRLRLGVLNVSFNKFSGEISLELGNLTCLQTLDLSSNIFSGTFPTSLNHLTELSKFNISYNPLIYGVVPATGHLAKFKKESFLGDPHLQLPDFMSNSKNDWTGGSSEKADKHTEIFVIIVFSALTVTLFVCGSLSLIVCKLMKRRGELGRYPLNYAKFRLDASRTDSSSSSPWSAYGVKIIQLDKTAFTYADILKATSNFSDERIIGKGGFGTVYYGELPDGREVAVKKLQRDGPESEREFQAEMKVLTGSGLGWPHPNLVTLYGWCLDGSDKILVYEYMRGGSVEDLITDRRKLNWQRRIEIAIDVARALVFLHHECFPAIVHRDVKASNVLLDKDGMARVTDFGLARVLDGNSHVSTMVAGTVGYVAPEYGQTMQATTKGDVYSFGILVMELATGRRAIDGGDECLVEWARRVKRIGRYALKHALQVMLTGSGQAGAAELCELLQVGLKCTAEAPQARPNMKEVLSMLIDIHGSDLEDFSSRLSPFSRDQMLNF